MLWTPELQDRARIEGWELIDCVDSGSLQPVLRIFGCKGLTNQQAQAHVMKFARRNADLHLTALRAIAASAVPIKGKR